VGKEKKEQRAAKLFFKICFLNYELAQVKLSLCCTINHHCTSEYLQFVHLGYVGSGGFGNWRRFVFKSKGHVIEETFLLCGSLRLPIHPTLFGRGFFIREGVVEATLQTFRFQLLLFLQQTVGGKT
jgi:hypothetical protein